MSTMVHSLVQLRAAPDAEPALPLLQPPERVLSTLNADGSRRWLKPKLSPGRFLSARRAVAYGLIALFVALPHVTINGKPAVLLDIVAREFTVLGKTFLPTDTLLLALLVLGVFLTIFVMTALLGRAWCGWACPQTVYMEFLFRPLERLFDGAPGRVRTTGFYAARFAGLRQGLKYASFVLAACFLAHTFLAYFVGVDALSRWVTQSPIQHPTPFLVMTLVTAAMLFDFVFFREQTCIVACPYGRLQSVLLDRDSLIVSYDRQRGEPRGKGRRAAAGAKSEPVECCGGTGSCGGARRCGGKGACAASEHGAEAGGAPVAVPAPASQLPTLGDCVDCRACVTTCPTGIDIRDGLQLECIGCAQCIDACDAVMRKLNRPEGLIRYSSQNVDAGHGRRLVRARTIIYPAVLTVVAAAFIGVLLSAGPVDVAILRDRGLPFYVLPDGRVANPVRISVTNRTATTMTYRVSVTGPGEPQLTLPGGTLTLAAGERRSERAQITLAASAFPSASAGKLGSAECAVTVRVEPVAAAADSPAGASEPKVWVDREFRVLGPHASGGAVGAAAGGQDRSASATGR